MSEQLDVELGLIDSQMNKVVENMGKVKAHPISISMADNVTRPLYKELAKAHVAEADVGHVEDAILSLVCSGLVDFMLRVHGNNNRGIVVDHLQLILNEMSLIISEEIATRFSDGPVTTTSVEVH